MAEQHVIPHIRVVPAGVRKNGKKNYLHATVMMTPYPVKNPTGITLENWVKTLVASIEDKGKWEIPLSIAPVKYTDNGSGTKVPTPVECFEECSNIVFEAHGLKAAFGKEGDSGAISKMNDLWNTGLCLTEYEWTSLAEALREGVSGEGIQPGKIAASGDYKSEALGLGARGQINQPVADSGARKVDTVVSVPHADLALFLESQRSAELASSLQQSFGRTEAKIEFERLIREMIAKAPHVLEKMQEFSKTESKNTDNKIISRSLGEMLEIIRDRKAEKRNGLFEDLLEARQRAHRIYAIETARVNRANCATVENESVSRIPPSMEIVSDAFSPRQETFKSICAIYEYASWPQHRNDQNDIEAIKTVRQMGFEGMETKKSERVQRTADNMGVKKALSTYYAAQSTPSVARLFCLAIDVRAPLNDVVECLNGDKGLHFISSEFSCKLAKNSGFDLPFPHPWTLAKYSKSQFVASSFDELATPPGDDCSTEHYFQYDGFSVMGMYWTNETPGRFDLTSMDVRRASEVEMKRQNNREIAVLEKREAKTASLEQSAQAPTIHTAGLSIIDRRSQHIAIRKLIAIKEKSTGSGVYPPCQNFPKGQIIMDSEDLTVGYRTDIGLPSKSGSDLKTRWRSLSTRYVEFGTSGAMQAEVKSVLRKMVGDTKSANRIMIDAAISSAPGRLLPNDKKPNGATDVESFTEEATTIWDGGPWAVDCLKISENTANLVEDSLPFGKTLDLPKKNESKSSKDTEYRDLLRHTQRYGDLIRIRDRIAFLGGYSVPLNFEPDDPNKRLYYPPDAVKAENELAIPYFRFLRQHRIDPPQVCLPIGHAQRRNDPMGYERCGEMIIRSVNGPSIERAKPVLSQRIILVPATSMDEAARHGVFDNSTLARPNGAFKRIKLVGKNGELPVTSTTFVEGIDSELYPISRTIQKKIPNAPSSEQKERTDQNFGEPVVEIINASDNDDKRYFPDPAATKLVVALRKPGEIIYSDYRVADVRESANDYLSTLPVCLTIAKASKADTVRAFVGSSPPQKVRISPDRKNGDIRGKGAQKALNVEVRLAQGEECEVDIWCVPSGSDLARIFSVVQALSVSAMVIGENDEAMLDERCLLGLGKVVCPEFRDSVEANYSKYKPTSDHFIGPGGLITPSREMLRAVGQALHDRLLKHPIPELTSVMTLRAAHAIDRPSEDPVLITDRCSDLSASLPCVARPEKARLESAIIEVKNSVRFTFLDDPDLEKIGKQIAPGSKEFALNIDAEINSDQADVLELHVETAFPTNSVFDDPNAKRTISNRQAGTWPKLVSDGKTCFRSSRDVFGFDVASDGVVTLPRSKAVLMRIEDLPRGRDLFDLLPYALQSPEASEENRNLVRQTYGRVTERHIFPDTKARRLTITPRVISRTVELMATANTPVEDSKISAGRYVLNAQQALPNDERPILGEPIEVMLNATERPAKCSDSDTTSFPRFEWKQISNKKGAKIGRGVCRDMVFSVKLKRGWFSSGEAEVLGIVVWPPYLESTEDHPTKVELKDDSILSWPGLYGNDAPRDITLPDFQDDDLGLGGSFISRLGADPMRDTQGPDGPFLPISVFSDLQRDSTDPRQATYIPSVRMPLGDGNTVEDFLFVGLITYVPRFDAINEVWFADISLNRRYLSDPYLRIGLVRYQPHADESIQVSQPITKWTQLLPRREAVLTHQPGSKSISLVIEGVSSDGFKGTTGPRDPVATPSKMRVKLDRKYRSAGGTLQREPVVFENGERHLLISPQKKDSAYEWRHEFSIETLKVEVGEINIFVEEIEVMRPATYIEEPIEKTQLNETKETGARFTVSLSPAELFPELILNSKAGIK